MNTKLIDSKYVPGSEGSCHLFFRPAGTRYAVAGTADDYCAVAAVDEYIIQWEGFPDFDSGYSEARYASLEEARAAFEGGGK
jgi:hypothetical protein